MGLDSNPAMIHNLPEEEREWRQKLQRGSKVDAIKIDTEYNLKVWAKGEVIDVNGDLLYVMFQNDNKSSSRYFFWYSPEIDQYNTKSEGDEWRLELKAGGFVDGFDTTKVWYASTI